MPITGRPAIVGAPAPPPAVVAAGVGTVVTVAAPAAAPPVSESVTDEKRFARGSFEPSSVGMVLLLGRRAGTIPAARESQPRAPPSTGWVRCSTACRRLDARLSRRLQQLCAKTAPMQRNSVLPGSDARSVRPHARLCRHRPLLDRPPACRPGGGHNLALA